MHRTASLLLAALLGLSVQAQAFDSSDPFGVNTPAEKPAKAPREKNDGRWLENQVTGFAAGAAAGAAANVSLGGAAAALNPVVALPVIAGLTVKLAERENTRVNAFYSGSVVRGRVRGIDHNPSQNNFGGYGWNSLKVVPSRFWGFDLRSFPLDLSMFDVVHLDVDGPDGTSVFAVVHKAMKYTNGDVVD